MLSDSGKRKVYDLYGDEVVQIHENYAPPPPEKGFLVRRYGEIVGAWALILILDYFLHFAIEW